MKVYGLKTAWGYSLITPDKSKLDKYKKNVLFPVVKLKVIKKEDGKYYMFTKKDKSVIITDNPITNRELNEKFEGKTIKINLEEC